ncbi:hypothetical protein [Bacteroides sp. 51]|uniref:hypothetical protein n=1 Tax=Bacteroides sp. 51 TaxID=2302938 RepID=UPI0013D45C19|nr:hypothetical protein [Bacteroides sp. 51]NDV81423.1 hypothetical protein [Bacteroides sp. 51]
MNARTNQKYTLEDIIQRKQEVLQDIQIQHQIIAETTQAIFAPILPSPKLDQTALIKKFNTGMAIFDGVMVGMKIFKSIRKFFKRGR